MPKKSLLETKEGFAYQPNSFRHTIVAALLLPFLSLSTAFAGTDAESFKVLSRSFAQSIEKREPVDVGKSFVADGKSDYAYLTVLNKGETKKIFVVFSHKGKERYRATLNIRRSKRYRAWARVRATRGRVGPWTVVVLDETQKELAKGEFEVTAK